MPWIDTDNNKTPLFVFFGAIPFWCQGDLITAPSVQSFTTEVPNRNTHKFWKYSSFCCTILNIVILLWYFWLPNHILPVPISPHIHPKVDCTPRNRSNEISRSCWGTVTRSFPVNFPLHHQTLNVETLIPSNIHIQLT